MTIIHNADRERQRVDHLVLGHARPRSEAPPQEISRKGRRRRKAVRIARAAEAPIALAPGIEEAVALRERWSHRQGTPETHEHAWRAQQRPGSIARLYHSEAIDRDQLAAAHEIAEAYRAITADVTIRTASLETRVDCSSHGKAEGQRFGAVLIDLAYDAWRSAIGSDAELLLSVIVYDVGLTIAARRASMSTVRARRVLGCALDEWHRLKGHSVKSAAEVTARPSSSA